MHIFVTYMHACWKQTEMKYVTELKSSFTFFCSASIGSCNFICCCSFCYKNNKINTISKQWPWPVKFIQNETFKHILSWLQCYVIQNYNRILQHKMFNMIKKQCALHHIYKKCEVFVHKFHVYVFFRTETDCLTYYLNVLNHFNNYWLHINIYLILS